MRAETRYRFAPGRIERSDVYTANTGTGPATLTLEFAGYQPLADLTEQADGWTITYAAGPATRLQVTGLDVCRTAPLEAVHASPTGPFQSLIRCTSSRRDLGAPVHLGWSLSYADGER